MLAPFNQMYLDGRIMEQQKHGIVVCIPKTDPPTTPADCRPIILLNTDYKILALIIANGLRPTLSDLLHRSQYSGVPSSTIFDAVTTVREALACSTMHPFVGLDSRFDRFAHTYLFRMLKTYGYSMRFNTLIQAIYDQAFS